MPWLIRKQGDKFCVYKEGADGNPTGSSRGCHDSRAAAERQRRALYREVEESAATSNVSLVSDTKGLNTFWFLPGDHTAGWANTTASLGSFVVTTSETSQDESEERGSAFEGVLAVVGSPTSDGRYLIPDEISNRDLPIPVMVQTATDQGHAGAEACGRIDAMEYISVSDFEYVEEYGLEDVREDSVVVWAKGTFDTSEFARDAERMLENGAGVSIDLPPERIAAFDPDSFEEIPEEEIDFEALMMGQYLVGIGGKIAALTIVAIPAFEEASITLIPGHALVASAYGLKVVKPQVLTAAAAGAAPLKPPRDWFFEPEADGPVPLTVTPEGKVYGHLALWNQCHPAFSSCETAPMSTSGYSFFHVGEIETDDGDLVAVGRITVGKEGSARGGHASVVLGRQGAMEHYDATGCVAAFVRAKDGVHGIWLSGAVRSDAPAEKIRDLRANPPSGDWRDYELVGVLSVPVPGFPIPRVEALIASAEDGQERVKAMIASGYSEDYEFPAEPLDIPTYRRRLRELAERRASRTG